MVNSTYTPKRFEDLNSDAVMLNGQCAAGTATAGAATNIDLQLTDDHIITGMTVIANGSNFGDTVTMQVIDNAGIVSAMYGVNWTAMQPTLYPNYPILRQFATNIMLPSDIQTKINKEAMYPAKVLANLYLRLIYSSTGTTNVSVAVNYELHKVLF